MGGLSASSRKTSNGELGFAYSPGWLQNDDAPPLSASLLKRVEPFSRRECRPFFGGLLPEESQRDAAAQALGVSRGNDFALLDRLGGDVAGALQLLPPGETPAAPDLDQRPIPLDDAGLIRVLDALPVRPLLAGEEGLGLSRAGAQWKVPVVLVLVQRYERFLGVASELMRPGLDEAALSRFAAMAADRAARCAVTIQRAPE